MTDVLMDTETAEIEPAGPPARPGTLRRLLVKRRSDRRGALGSTEMVQLIGVILLIALLAGGTFVYLRFIRGSSENSVVQRNIDEVAKIADAYWQSYAADSDGRRKVSLGRFCEFANNQLAEDDLKLRTLQMGPDAGQAVTPVALATANAANNMASRIVVNNGINDVEASCFSGTANGGPTQEYQDIFAYPDKTPAAAISDAASGKVTDYVHADGGGIGTTAITDEQHKISLDRAGLLSTATVWMAQYGTGTGVGGLAPAGTDTAFNNTDRTGQGVEVFVFGGMSPSGDSFCLIKVFDASDADDIGEYRVSRIASDGDELEFATCLSGTAAGGEYEPRRGGQWPEPQ